MHPMITNEEYMFWYTSITRQIITPNPEQVLPLGFTELNLGPSGYSMTLLDKPSLIIVLDWE
jgi:hypothetical protein